MAGKVGSAMGGRVGEGVDRTVGSPRVGDGWTVGEAAGVRVETAVAEGKMVTVASRKTADVGIGSSTGAGPGFVVRAASTAIAVANNSAQTKARLTLRRRTGLSLRAASDMGIPSIAYCG